MFTPNRTSSSSNPYQNNTTSSLMSSAHGTAEDASAVLEHDAEEFVDFADLISRKELGLEIEVRPAPNIK